MMQKLVVVVGVAILVALVQGGPIDDHSNPEEEIAGYLHRLEIDVLKLLEKANETLSFAILKVSEAANATKKEAVALMKSTEQELRNELDELKKKAADAGVNIDDCLEGNEDELVNLPNVFVGQLTDCVSDNLIAALSDVQDVVKELETLATDVDAIKQDFDKCRQEEKNSKCLFQVVLEIKKENELLIKIEKDAEATAHFITKLHKKIETCGITTVAKYEKDVKEISEEIITCVTDKLHH